MISLLYYYKALHYPKQTHASIQTPVINDAVLFYSKHSNNTDVLIVIIVAVCLNEFLGATWMCVTPERRGVIKETSLLNLLLL